MNENAIVEHEGHAVIDAGEAINGHDVRALPEASPCRIRGPLQCRTCGLVGYRATFRVIDHPRPAAERLL